MSQTVAYAFQQESLHWEVTFSDDLFGVPDYVGEDEFPEFLSWARDPRRAALRNVFVFPYGRDEAVTRFLNGK